jgi:hypothetical protein
MPIATLRWFWDAPLPDGPTPPTGFTTDPRFVFDFNSDVFQHFLLRIKISKNEKLFPGLRVLRVCIPVLFNPQLSSPWSEPVMQKDRSKIKKR